MKLFSSLSIDVQKTLTPRIKTFYKRVFMKKALKTLDKKRREQINKIN